MTECIRLSDRMPLVALGRARWTDEEARHLSGCPSCQSEWELVRLAIRVGRASPELDRSGITHALLSRLELEPVERIRRRAWGFAGLAAAAIIAALVWTGRPVVRPPTPPTPTVARLQIPLPELDSLPSAELDSVLHTMDKPVGNGSALDPSLGELDSTELQNVLDYWEG